MKYPLIKLWMLCIIAMATTLSAQTPLSSEFSYQGQLKASGLPTVANADFQFSLFDAASGGVQIGTVVTRSNLALVSGTFTTSLDFGAAAFSGDARWLEISVRAPAGAGGFATLSPRQALAATPNATYSLQTRGVSVNSAGDVGIGTIAPAARLHVEGNIRAKTGIDIIHPTNSGGSMGLSFGQDTAGVDVARIRIGGTGAGVSNGFDLQHQGNNSLLRILQDGRVGIGTVAPATPLHIRNDEPVMVLQDPGPSSTQSGYIGFWNGNSSETGWIGFGSPGSPHFTVTNTRPGGDINILPNSGNVGVGTNEPASKLHVAGTTRLDGDTQVLGTFQVKRNFGDTAAFQDSQGRAHFRMTTQVNEDYPTFRMISPITGDIQAGMFRSVVDDNGVLHADEKNFRAPNPADPATDIWYCCPEGPEAAMYVRGTTRLTNGRAIIDLPDHFRNLASEPGMTVQLTPRSLDSKGLATSKVSLAGIEVGELSGGIGNYEFDWRVEAVRKGWEDYKVIRPWMQSDSDPDKSWQNRLKWIEERRARGKPSPSSEIISATRPN